MSLKSYDAAQFLRDYHFLSQIGRQVSAAGKHLLDRGLLPQQVEATSNAVVPSPPLSSGNSVRGLPGPSYRPDFDKVKRLRARQALKDKVRQRKCKVMWLPEGMAREAQNRTAYIERQRRIRWSCEIAWTCAPQQESGKLRTAMHHDLPPNLPIEVKVLSELERHSWRIASKDWKNSHRSSPDSAEPGNRLSRKRIRKGLAKASHNDHSGPSKEEETGASFAVPEGKTYYISDKVLADFGLVGGPTTANSAQDASTRAVPRPYTRLPDSVTLAVQVYRTRLRNESTLKYLEWWTRRGRQEQADLKKVAASQDQLNFGVADGALRLEADHVPPAPIHMHAKHDAAALAQRQNFGDQPDLYKPSLVVAPSFLPPALLTQLSAKLEGSRASSAAATAALPSRGFHRSFTNAQHGFALDYSSDSEDGKEEAHLRTSDHCRALSDSLGEGNQRQPTQRQPTRLLYVLSRERPGTATAAGAHRIEASDKTQTDAMWSGIGIEGLLRSLPRCYAVVEFPRIEVWNTQELKEAASVRPHQNAPLVELVEWDVRVNGTVHPRGEAPSQKLPSSAATVSAPSDQVRQARTPSIDVPALAPPKPVPAEQSGLGPTVVPTLAGLAHYGSDEDESSAGEDVNAEPVIVTEKRERRASPLTEVARVERLLSERRTASTPSTLLEGTSSESETEAMSLAAIARLLGFTSSAAKADQMAVRSSSGSGKGEKVNVSATETHSPRGQFDRRYC